MKDVSTDFSRTLRFGTWQLIANSSVSRFLARSGWDYVIVDMQHGAISMESAYECLHTLRAYGVKPWLRVPVDDYAAISKALDAGAETVVFPMANTAAHARRAVTTAKYPPLGQRSVGGDVWHHLGYDYIPTAGTATHLVLQIEHREAVAALPEISAVEGVDGYFAGPVDLAFSLGLSLDTYDSDPGHQAAVQAVLDMARNTGKLACINCSSPADVHRRAAQGFEYISIQSDVDQLLSSGRKLVSELKAQPATSATQLV